MGKSRKVFLDTICNLGGEKKNVLTCEAVARETGQVIKSVGVFSRLENDYFIPTHQGAQNEYISFQYKVFRETVEEWKLLGITKGCQKEFISFQYTVFRQTVVSMEAPRYHKRMLERLHFILEHSLSRDCGKYGSSRYQKPMLRMSSFHSSIKSLESLW